MGGLEGGLVENDLDVIVDLMGGGHVQFRADHIGVVGWHVREVGQAADICGCTVFVRTPIATASVGLLVGSTI